MPLKVVRRPRVREDVLEIWRYISRDNLKAADDVVDHFNEVIVMLSRHPQAGRARPDLGPDLRSFPDGRFLLVYTYDERTLEVVRIVSGARNLTSDLFED